MIAPVPLDYNSAQTKLMDALDADVAAGLSAGGHLVASFGGTFRAERSLADLGVPVAPFEDPEALALRVDQVALTLRRDRFTGADWSEINGGAGQRLSMHYGDMTFTLRWASRRGRAPE